MLKNLQKKITSKRARARLWPWVKKTLTLVAITLTLLAFSPSVTYEGVTAGANPTATIAPTPALQATITSVQADDRILKLQAYLESKNSPLANYAVDFVTAADKYGLDWRLLPAIAGDESGFAKAYVRNSYNAWGWGGGWIYLGSWPNAIEVISKALRENYLNRGATTVPQIARIYAADPYWAGKVLWYMNQIDNFKL
jgi:hypothetical protein